MLKEWRKKLIIYFLNKLLAEVVFVNGIRRIAKLKPEGISFPPFRLVHMQKAREGKSKSFN